MARGCTLVGVLVAVAVVLVGMARVGLCFIDMKEWRTIPASCSSPQDSDFVVELVLNQWPTWWNSTCLNVDCDDSNVYLYECLYYAGASLMSSSWHYQVYSDPLCLHAAGNLWFPVESSLSKCRPASFQWDYEYFTEVKCKDEYDHDDWMTYDICNTNTCDEGTCTTWQGFGWCQESYFETPEQPYYYWVTPCTATSIPLAVLLLIVAVLITLL
ncbi:hypothetical protein Pelo_12603 [Pelomyxa schiedti]|nr:hypothetical protein Pelo_12603 [Pelomyxa schiedti]